LTFDIDKFDSNKSFKKFFGKLDSFGTKEGYRFALIIFCRKLNKNPDQLIQMKKKLLEHEIDSFLDGIPCKKTRRHRRGALKKFFEVNGRKNLEISVVKVRSREPRVRPEYVPTLEEAWKMADYAGSLKNRLVIIILFITGLRISTLRVLKYGEVPTKELWLKEHTIKNELNNGKKNLAIIVDPEMKKYAPNACKDKIPYYVFTSEELTETLKNYLDERERKNGKIDDDEFLFPSGYRGYSQKERANKPISTREIQRIVKNAARNAGLKHWKYVTPHCLRKTFMMTLINQPEGSRLDEADREFFMGHILKGAQESYFVRTGIERLREKFSKLSFSPNPPSEKEHLTKELAKLYGIDYEVVVSEAEKRSSRKPTHDEIMTVLGEFIAKRNKKEQKIINLSELQDYIKNGWLYLNHLPDGTAIVYRDA